MALVIGLLGFAWQATIARNQRDKAIAAEQAEVMERQRAGKERNRAVAAESETRKPPLSCSKFLTSRPRCFPRWTRRKPENNSRPM